LRVLLLRQRGLERLKHRVTAPQITSVHSLQRHSLVRSRDPLHLIREQVDMISAGSGLVRGLQSALMRAFESITLMRALKSTVMGGLQSALLRALTCQH